MNPDKNKIKIISTRAINYCLRLCPSQIQFPFGADPKRLLKKAQGFDPFTVWEKEEETFLYGNILHIFSFEECHGNQNKKKIEREREKRICLLGDFPQACFKICRPEKTPIPWKLWLWSAVTQAALQPWTLSLKPLPRIEHWPMRITC